MARKAPDSDSYIPSTGQDAGTDDLIVRLRKIDPDLGRDLAALDQRLLDDAHALGEFTGLLLKMATKAWLPYVLRLFALTDRSVLLPVGTTVGRIRSKSATRRLIEILKAAPLASQREAAALALGNLMDRRALSGLARALTDESEEVRDMAAEALQPLAGLGHPSAVRALVAALRDRACAVRWSAAWALAGARDASVVDALELLLDDHAAPPGNTTVAEVAAESINEIRQRTEAVKDTE